MNICRNITTQNASLNMSNLFDKYRYSLLKIDVTDTYVFADIFDDEKYIKHVQSNNVEELLDLAVIRFWEDNPKIKTFSDWESEAEEGATEYQIISPQGTIFRGCMLLYDSRIMGAIYLMRLNHGGQKRKGDGYPYLEHPLEVGYMLWRQRLPGEVVAAGLCHDLLEDTKCTEAEILDACGDEVLRIVKAVSNDETLSDKKDWEKKKAKYVETVRAGGEKAIAVSIADKIANLHSFLNQYEKEGPALWKKFNRGKDKKVWFEKKVLQMARKEWSHSSLDELESLIVKLEETKE